MRRVCIIGAGGYVGRFLARELRRRGHDVVPITRDDPWKSVPGLDAVINLAHPNRGPSYAWRHGNDDIFRRILSLASDGTRVIQTCTLAVFGDRLERKPRAGPVPWRRDLPYIECKLELQCRLLRWRGRGDLHIVRLGHVWGPGSPSFTERFVTCLEKGVPVGVEGLDGYCNATDVVNVASYMAHLVEGPPSDGPRFHHLAELGHIRWSFFIDRLARFVGREPVRVRRLPPLRWGILRGRRTGSYARAILRRLPPSVVETLRRRLPRPATPAVATIDPAFLRLLCCDRLFESHVDAAWVPPVDAEASWESVARWLGDQGESTA